MAILHKEKTGVLTGQDSRQTVSIWDALCEGPIEGLVDGNASVFINNDPVVESGSSDHISNAHVEIAKTTVTLTNGAQTAVLVTGDDKIDRYKDRWLTIFNAATFGGVSGTVGSNTITVSGGISSFAHSANFINKNILRVPDANADGTTADFVILRYVNSTTITVFPTPQKAFTNATATYDVVLGKVTGTSGTTTLTVGMLANWPYPTGAYKFAAQSPAYNFNPQYLSQARDDFGDGKKVKRSTVQFRTGHSDQPTIKEIGHLQGNSINRTININRALGLVAGYFQLNNNRDDNAANELDEFISEEGTDSEFVIDSVNTLGLSNSGEVDELLLTFQYDALKSFHYAKGKLDRGFAAYKVIFSYTRDGGSTYTDVELPYIEHLAEAVQAFAIDDRINLESYQPFDKFKLKISRVTSDKGLWYPYNEWSGRGATMYNSNGSRKSPGYFKNRVVAPSRLATVTSIIKYKLNYPFTAFAAVTFDSKQFADLPTRSYHIRGKKIQVPKNYVTREEASDGIASYNRDSNGAIQSSYQDWDGTFREEVYTNNPAWILYDALLSKRYGLGRFIDSVDKWSFFRVARYCDELVSDGKGGLEPRYTCNLVLQKQTSARRVIQDMATNFLGMLHWLDGEVYLTSDRPSSPVYTFGRGNVLGGLFSYSSTEYKKRPNQFVVVWNNPELDYGQDYVLVEDTANIVERGLIISKDAFAFGCTSRGQAERFGRWKLFTTALQTESVSFGTSINATFLNPGDVISIQDGNRQTLNLSGRIAASGTVSTTVVRLDRNVVLLNNHSYILNVMFFTPAAILVDKTATVNSVAYVQGDAILTDNSGNALTEVSVNNLKDEQDSNRPINVIWKESNHVQSRPVSTGVGTVNSITVSSAFGAVPTRETMWSLTSTNNNIVQGASAKEYLVTSVEQRGPMEWGVTAVDYSTSKFSAIESNFNLEIPDADFKGGLSTDIIPMVSNLALALSND